jgi:hypothetical protein
MPGLKTWGGRRMRFHSFNGKPKANVIREINRLKLGALNQFDA